MKVETRFIRPDGTVTANPTQEDMDRFGARLRRVLADVLGRAYGVKIVYEQDREDQRPAS